MPDPIKIEIIYISSNKKIVSTKINFQKNLKLGNVLEYLEDKSIFSKKFLSKKKFGCYGNLINESYIIKETDRIEILDDLKMSPNEKRKFNFQKKF